MTARVFVPMTDDMMEAPDGRGTPLVPYHPDRPCWRLDPPDRNPGAEPAKRLQNRNPDGSTSLCCTETPN